MQVLLIDDERAIRRALREILEFEGCLVDEAENGAQALEKLKANTALYNQLLSTDAFEK
jgi:CheY-like chemotaxis protein